MNPVPPVLGPVEVDALGRTDLHEPVFVLTPDAQQNRSDEWDEETRLAAGAVDT